MPRGFRPCSHHVPFDDEERVRLVLARYSCVENIRREGDRLRWDLDLSRVALDGPAQEGEIEREIAKAISLHRVGP